MKNNLGLEGYEIADVIEEEHSVLIYVQPEKETRKCPNCGCGNCYVKDKKERFYRDVEFMGKHAEVAIVSKRFICNDCNNTFYSEITCMDDTFKMTTRLKKRIREEGFLNTFTALSLRYGVDEKTIRNVFKEYSEELDKDWKILAPEVLGIDECHLANYARSVFVDVKKKNSKLIEMAKDSKKVTVEKVLNSMHNPDNTKIVTMDMTNTYKHAVQYVLPNATIVIDKFHVLQTVVGATSDSFKLVRSKMEESFESLSKEDRIEIKKRYKSLKISVNMFRSNIEDLNVLQTTCLAEAVRIYPDFAKVMALKENFRDMMNKPKNREEAEKKFMQWEKDIPEENEFEPFRDAAKTVNNWHNEIFNYFDYRESNGPVEALNGVVKILNRNGRGYSYEVIRAKALYRTITPQVPKYSRPISKPGVLEYLTPFAGPKLIEGSGVDIDRLYAALNKTTAKTPRKDSETEQISFSGF